MAIEKAPAYQMYARDWLGSRNVRLMQDFQRGWYIQLLNEAWDNDPQGMLPNDQEMLMQLAGVTEARKSEPWFNQRWAAVMERFEVDGAWVFNAKQLAQVADQIAYRERQSRAGSASAKIRAERKAEVARLLQEANAGSTVVQPSLNGGSIPVATKPQPDLNSPPASAPASASAEKHTNTPQAEPAGVTGTLDLPIAPPPAKRQGAIAGAIKDRFEQLWTVAGKKVCKAEAFAEFKKVNPDDDLLVKMIAARSFYVNHTDPDFQRRLYKWIRGRNWEDELQTMDSKPKSSDAWRGAEN